MYAFSSILTALYARERTGSGAALAVSLFESLTEWMSQPLYYAMYTGVPPARTGTSHATIAPYGAFRTGGGGRVQFSIQNDREWHRLCEQVLGQPGLADDPRFVTNEARVAARADLDREIEAVLSKHPVAEVIAMLDAAQIANAQLKTVGDVLTHPQLEHRWTEIGTPAGPIRALPPPISTGGAPLVLGAVPAVGEHTDVILAELGLTSPEIAALREAGAV
jgi:itaconate CoA-transferase